MIIRAADRPRAGQVLVALLLATTAAAVAAQQPVRDAAIRATTSEVSGVVLTDDAKHQPAKRALVMIAGTDVGLIRVAQTDDTGRFAFTALPAGRFVLGAGKPAYISAMYGAPRSGRPGDIVSVAAGQKLASVTLRLSHGAAIEGRVMDGNGQPLVTARVRALPRRLIGDEVVIGVDAGDPAGAVTDDRGAYRIYDLMPGEYVIAVQPRSTMGANIRLLTGEDIDAGGSPTSGAPSAAPAQIALPVAYAQVYYPAADTAVHATPIVLHAGDERVGIDVKAPLVRLARIEGTVIGEGNAPPRLAQITLRPRGIEAAGTILNAQNASLTPDGRFSFGGVPPGDYTIQARTVAPPAPADMSEPRVPFAPQWAMADVAVAGASLSNVTLTLQPAMTVTGQVAITGLPRLPADLAVRIGLRSTPASAVPSLPDQVTSNPDGTFTLTNVWPGKYRLFAQLVVNDVNLPPDWVPQSAIVGGSNVLDVPFELKPSQRSVQVALALTDQMQEITGTVRDAAGKPRRDSTVIVFPVDRRWWFPQSRWIAVRQSRANGEFVFGEATGLPPGDYYAIAVPSLGPGEQFDPSVLGELAATARTFTLSPNASQALDLKIGGS